MFGNGMLPYGSVGLGAATKAGINWSSLLTNTQKTLGIINQAIPAFYQVKPIFNNMKTMFRVVNELNKNDSVTPQNNSVSQETTNTTNTTEYTSTNNNEGPNFFV